MALQLQLRYLCDPATNYKKVSMARSASLRRLPSELLPKTGSSRNRVGKYEGMMLLRSLVFQGFVRMQGVGNFGTIPECSA